MAATTEFISFSLSNQTPQSRAFKEATAAFSEERMDATHELNGPSFAHAILTTTEGVAAMPNE